MVLLDQSITGTTFVVYIGLAYNILTPAKGISKASYSIQKGNAAADRILEILNTKNSIEDSKDAVLLKSFKKSILFDKVFFSYSDKPIITNLSFEIKKGEMVALVGPSGSGKTTLTYLLNRLYEIEKGVLSIDDIPRQKSQKKSLYQNIGMVTQESILFNDTIENNIIFGDQLDEKRLIEAAKVANAHDFIHELEKDYQTNIGDGGNKLSGGQRQRISIARAVYKNPSILILDEATSALDTESEKLVQDALNKLMNNRTSIVIAHRLSTIQHADEIIVLQKGKIVERGSHQLLMSNNGIYKKLV